MKYYFVAKTPTSGFVGQFTIEEIAAGLRAKELKGDYVATASTGLPYAEFVKQSDISWLSISEIALNQNQRLAPAETPPTKEVPATTQSPENSGVCPKCSSPNVRRRS